MYVSSTNKCFAFVWKEKKVKRYSMCMVDALGLDADEGRVRLR